LQDALDLVAFYFGDYQQITFNWFCFTVGVERFEDPACRDDKGVELPFPAIFLGPFLDRDP
jgi:hypothetical protein